MERQHVTKFHYSHEERGQSVFQATGTIAVPTDYRRPTLYPSVGVLNTDIPASQILLDQAGRNSYVVRRQGE